MTLLLLWDYNLDMSRLSDYRIRIKSLLNSGEIEQTLISEGVPPVSARAIAVSKAVIAQRSIVRKKPLANELVKAQNSEDEKD